ncbi:YigZ family protein [Sulfurimonas sp.]|nr:YigZ family protein [Sulfurimonas sp.]
MTYINISYTNTLEVKQSKFITYLVPIHEYKGTLSSLKEEHPKARHFVVAYRYLNTFNQVVEHSSDDGEPKGTSGKPSLMVLQGNQLINSAVIVVRYFGGTKLGTGGLVRAYSDAVNLVLDKAELKEYKEEVVKKISFEYTHIRQIEYQCSICRISILNKLFDTKTIYEVKADIKSMEEFLCRVDRISSIYP